MIEIRHSFVDTLYVIVIFGGSVHVIICTIYYLLTYLLAQQVCLRVRFWITLNDYFHHVILNVLALHSALIIWNHEQAPDNANIEEQIQRWKRKRF